LIGRYFDVNPAKLIGVIAFNEINKRPHQEHSVTNISFIFTIIWNC